MQLFPKNKEGKLVKNEKGVLFLIDVWSKIVDNGQSSGLSDKIQGAKKLFCLASFSGFKHSLLSN